MENKKWVNHKTYFGSQCAILKSKFNLVTNISDSSRTSWTEGGGNAIANATRPRRTGADFREWPKIYWGLKVPRMSTTCKENQNENFNEIEFQKISFDKWNRTFVI